MRSTFSVLFYTKNQSLKDGKVPIMGPFPASIFCSFSFVIYPSFCRKVWEKGNVKIGLTDTASPIFFICNTFAVRKLKKYFINLFF